MSTGTAPCASDRSADHREVLSSEVLVQPVLTRRQMQALDRQTIEGLGLPGPVLMEVAGRAVADAVDRLLGPSTGRVVALVGPGNNGGDAVVAARHLSQRGRPVELIVLGPAEGRSA
ncbi:MAG: hypothetical protein DYG91_10240, partial [Chloroflexi bacterium CFX7]|nr:hypothetical protein [Chloroflexi bacterium CFX7]